MQKEQMSQIQLVSLIIMFEIGTSLALLDFSTSLQDTWLSLIVALLMVIPFIFIYGAIMNMFPGKDIFQILILIYGKLIGKIISLLYVIYFYAISSLSARAITEYIQVVSFPETPQYYPAILIGILAIYSLKSGIEVIGRVSKFLLPLIVLIIIVTFIGALPKAQFSNLLPVLYNGWEPVLSSAVSIFAFPFAEIVMFMTLLNKSEINRPTRILLKGMGASFILLFIAAIRNIIIMGFPTLAESTFPSYYAVSLIDTGIFIRGVELIVSMNISIAGFFTVMICSYSACIGLSRVFNTDNYKKFVIPVVLLSLPVSYIFFDGILNLNQWNKDAYHYYALPFQVILPVLTLIVGLIRRKIHKKQ